MNILLFGGSFNEKGGKSSGLISKLADAMANAYGPVLSYLGNFVTGNVSKYRTDRFALTVYNGGSLEMVDKVLADIKDYDIVFWFANIPNDVEKKRNIKELNQKCILVMSKRNNYEYTHKQLVVKALEQKANLLLEFCKTASGQYRMTLLDPLGNKWSDTVKIEETAKALLDRTFFLKDSIRIGTEKWLTTVGYELTKELAKELQDFFNIIKEKADVFHCLLQPDEGCTRMLGNSSFIPETRCMKGFPSFRDSSITPVVFVSKRNVDKRFIPEKDFVPVKFNEDRSKVEYVGPYKPSVDTPIQLSLYELFPQIRFMIHGHVYIEGVPMSEDFVPCGDMREVDQVKKMIAQGLIDPEAETIAFNLKGHGCVIAAKHSASLNDYVFKARPCLEDMR